MPGINAPGAHPKKNYAWPHLTCPTFFSPFPSLCSGKPIGGEVRSCGINCLSLLTDVHYEIMRSLWKAESFIYDIWFFQKHIGLYHGRGHFIRNRVLYNCLDSHFQGFMSQSVFRSVTSQGEVILQWDQPISNFKEPVNSNLPQELYERSRICAPFFFGL
jgi:hypothetical protein